MASKLIFLIGFCLLQGTWSYPSPAETSGTTSATVSTGTGTTAGSKLSADFNNKLASILRNGNRGFSSLTTPIIKTVVDRIPNRINDGVQTAAQKVAKFSEANKENSAKLASGVSKAVGGGVTLGSAVAGGIMEMAGSGVDAISNVVDSGAKGALSLGGQMADSGISGLGTLTNIGEGLLNTAGDGLTAAGGGVTVLTGGMSKIFDSLSKRMANSITKAADTMTKLIQEQATTTNANVATAASTIRTNIYTGMETYIKLLDDLQNFFETMNAISSSAAVTTSSDDTGTTTSTTVTAST